MTIDSRCKEQQNVADKIFMAKCSRQNVHGEMLTAKLLLRKIMELILKWVHMA